MTTLDELRWQWVEAFLELCAATSDEARRVALARLAAIEAQERACKQAQATA